MHTQGKPTNDIQRFAVVHRLLHMVVMFGFTGLAITGLSIAYPANPVSRLVVWLLGGPAHAGGLHRFCAVVTYGSVFTHALYFLYYRWVLGGRWVGAHSILPAFKDLRDIRDHFAYFMGRRPCPPDFDRFTYMEKIDYWAVFIGMHTMGITGLVLWFPEAVAGVLPGVVINIALILHRWEAILAVVVKVFIHVGLAHLRPSLFPADMTIFHGRMDPERLKHEHPGQWRRLNSTDPADRIAPGKEG
jgi:cytochrome b subunit of formate dehydrogenase